MININPIIEKLNISNDSKIYFSKLELHEILEDDITVLSKGCKIEEARKNLWSFNISDNLTISKSDLKEFYKELIKYRSKFLRKNYPGLKMSFYTWYDAKSGNFYFSLISEGEKLPFGCDVINVNSLEDIIEEYIEDSYKGVIPLEEIDITVLSDDLQESNDENQHSINLWSLVIPNTFENA